MNELRNLDQLLAPKFGPNKKITNIEVSKPPQKGVGSLMLKAEVTVQDQSGSVEVVHLVCKKIPASEFLREGFDIQKTFKKEVAFYEEILPLVREFEKEERITDVMDSFAEFYGARFSLEGKSEVVNEDAVMLLEDLSVKGFHNAEHEKGFNYNGSQKILKDLAKFHGSVIALKLKKPEVFHEKIKPLCTPFQFKQSEAFENMYQVLKELIQTFPEYAHLAETATNFPGKPTPTTYREPWGTVIHFDLWTNNILNKVKDDDIEKNVLVDFQVYACRSPAVDVFFHLWTSVQKEVLEEHLDDLLVHYHQNLLKTLEGYTIDTSQFGYHQFLEEIRLETGFEFGHALGFVCMLKAIRNLDSLINGFKLRVEHINPEVRDLIHLMVSECHKRGWLY